MATKKPSEWRMHARGLHGVNIPSPLPGRTLAQLARAFRYRTSVELIEGLLANPPKKAPRTTRCAYEVHCQIAEPIWASFVVWAGRAGLRPREAAGWILGAWVAEAEQKRERAVNRSPWHELDTLY